MKRYVRAGLLLSAGLTMLVIVPGEANADRSSACVTLPQPPVVQNATVAAPHKVAAFPRGNLTSGRVLFNRVGFINRYRVTVYKSGTVNGCFTLTRISVKDVSVTTDLKKAGTSTFAISAPTSTPVAYAVVVQALNYRGQTGQYTKDVFLNKKTQLHTWDCAYPLLLADSVSSWSKWVLSQMSNLPDPAGSLARSTLWTVEAIEVVTGKVSLSEYGLAKGQDAVVTVVVTMAKTTGKDVTAINVTMKVREAVALVEGARKAGAAIAEACIW